MLRYSTRFSINLAKSGAADGAAIQSSRNGPWSSHAPQAALLGESLGWRHGLVLRSFSEVSLGVPLSIC